MSGFLTKLTEKILKRNGSLRAIAFSKRVWLLSSVKAGGGSPGKKRTLKASMTLEASLVLPLYLFFLGTLLFSFEMLRFQNNMLEALHQTGSKMSYCGYYFRYAFSEVLDPDDEVMEMLIGKGGALLLSETYVRSSVEDFLGEDYMSTDCLQGGYSAVSYLRSNIMSGGDLIDLVADYRIKNFIPLMGIEGFSMQSRFYGHAFVGYSVGSSSASGEEKDETYVYITATGTVYHLSENCTYLKPSVRTIDASQLSSARNEEGARYYACESCDPVRSGTLLITTEGNRYHSDSSCPALKRTIYTVSLESVEGKMPACSKCGGGT